MARLTKLMEWQQAGLIDAETINRIKDYETHRQKKKRVPLLLIVGLTFVGLALLSFLAANWQVIPALIKIGLVLVLMVSIPRMIIATMAMILINANQNSNSP